MHGWRTGFPCYGLIFLFFLVLFPSCLPFGERVDSLFLIYFLSNAILLYIIFFLLFIVSSSNLKSFVFFLIVLVNILHVLMWLEVGLLHFSGKSFSPEFYFHLNLESFQIAVMTYYRHLIFIVIIIVLVNFLLCKYFFNKKHEILYKGQLLIIILVFLCSGLYQKTTLSRVLINAYSYYIKSEFIVDITASDQNVLNSLNIHLVEKGKADINVEVSTVPKNFILIYLESMNFYFINNPEFRNSPLI